MDTSKARRLLAALSALAVWGLVAQQAHAEPTPAAHGIPFEYASTQAPLIVTSGKIGGRREDAAVVIDTGGTAPFPVFVSTAMAGRLTLVQSEEITPADTTAIGPRRQRYRTAQLDRFELGPVELGPTQIAVLPMIDEMSAHVGRPIDAIVGYTFLQDRIISIDYAAQQVNLAASPGSDLQAVNFTLAARKPMILVQVSVNGIGPLTMEIDTGATATVLSPSAAKRTGIVMVGEGQQAGANGTIAVGIGRGTFAFAGVERAVAPVAIAEAMTSISAAAGTSIDGILGTDFFKGSRLVIDYPHKKLWVTAQ